MAGPIRISILADARNAINGFRQTESAANTMGSRLSKVGGLLKGALFAGAAVGATAFIAGAKQSVEAAADLSAAVSTNKTIFKESAAEVLKYGENAAKSLGLSNAEVLNGTKQFGNYFTAVGLSTKQAAKLSTGLTTASANLAAFGDSTPTEALEAMTSALRGEYDPLQKYIPTINAAAVQQKAMQMTGKKNAKSLTDQEKALALNNLVLESNANKLGAAEQKQGGLSVQTAKLKAQLTDMSAKIGSAVLPYLLKLATFVNDKVIPAVQAFWKDNGPGITAVFKQIGSGVSTILGGLGKFAGLIKSAFESGPIQSFLSTFKGIATSGESLGLISTYIATVKANFQSFADNLARFKPIVAEVVDFFTTKFQEIAPKIQAIIGQVSATLSAAGEAIRAIFTAVTTAVLFIWNNFGATILSYISSIIDAVILVVSGFFSILQGIFQVITGILTGNWGKAWDGVKNIVTGAVNVVKGVLTALMASVSAAASAAKTVLIGAWNAIKSATSSAWNAIKSAVSSAMSALKTAVLNGINSAVSYVKSLPGKAKAALGNLAGIFTSVGRSIIDGIISGVGGAAGALYSKLRGIASGALNAAKGALGIHSPSKAFEAIGRYVGVGFIQGLTGTESKILSTVRSLASKIIAAFPDVTKTITTGKGKNKKTTKKTIENKTQDRLLKLVDSGNKKLNALAKTRAAVAKKLDDATKTLADLQKKRADKVAEVSNQIKDLFNIVAEGENGASQSIKGIIARAQRAVKLAQDFTKNIALLKSKGLSTSALDQIASAGPEAAASTIEALLKGTPADIKQINKAYTDLATAGTAAGNTVASSLYDSGIKAAQGLVAGLAKQQKAIEAQMLKIALGMQKAIKKALGIKSPSKVFQKIGENTALGFVKGFDSVDAPMFSSAKYASAGVAGTTLVGAGGNTYITNITAGVGDPVAIGRQLDKVHKQYEAATGRTVGS